MITNDDNDTLYLNNLWSIRDLYVALITNSHLRILRNTRGYLPENNLDVTRYAAELYFQFLSSHHTVTRCKRAFMESILLSMAETEAVIWQLPLQPVATIPSKWHYNFCTITLQFVILIYLECIYMNLGIPHHSVTKCVMNASILTYWELRHVKEMIKI